MVKSGLVNRPWVNAYKLSLHFILAMLSVGAMVKTVADAYSYSTQKTKNHSKLVAIVLAVTFVQLIFAGLMSGMKAGVYFPTWPDMNGTFVPNVLLDSNNWTLHNLTNYDTFTFAVALVQFTHRFFAYLLLILVAYMFLKTEKSVSKLSKKWLQIVLTLLLFQISLGVLVLLNIGSGIPLLYGSLHQLFGVLFFMSLLFLFFSLRKIKA